MRLKVPLSLWLDHTPISTRNRALYYKTRTKLSKRKAIEILSLGKLSNKIISNLIMYSEIGWKEWLDFYPKINSNLVQQKKVDIEIIEEVLDKLRFPPVHEQPGISIQSCYRFGLLESGEKIVRMTEGKNSKYVLDILVKTFSDFRSYYIGKRSHNYRNYVPEDLFDLIRKNENYPGSEEFVKKFELDLIEEPEGTKPFFHQAFSNISDQFFLNNFVYYFPHIRDYFPVNREGSEERKGYHFDIDFFFRNWEILTEEVKVVFWCHFPFIGNDLDEFSKHEIPLRWDLLSVNIGCSSSFYKRASSYLDWKKILIEQLRFHNSVTNLISTNNNYWRTILDEDPQKTISVLFSICLPPDNSNYENLKTGERVLSYMRDNYKRIDFSGLDFKELVKSGIGQYTISSFIDQVISEKPSEVNLKDIEEIIASSDVYFPSLESAKLLNWVKIKKQVPIGKKRNMVNRIIRDLKKEGL